MTDDSQKQALEALWNRREGIVGIPGRTVREDDWLESWRLAQAVAYEDAAKHMRKLTYSFQSRERMEEVFRSRIPK